VCPSEIETVITGVGFASLVSTCQVSIVTLKNRFSKPLWNGYRDAIYTLRVRAPGDGSAAGEDGGDDAEASGVWHNCECQLHMEPYYDARLPALRAYVAFRPYFLGQEAVFAERERMLRDVHRCGREGLKHLTEKTEEGGDEIRMLALEDLLGFGNMEAFALATLLATARRDLAVNRNDDLATVKAQRTLVAYALASGDVARAVAEGAACLDDCREKLGARHATTARVRLEVAHVLEASGDAAGALAATREAHDVLEAAEGPAHSDTLEASVTLARLLATAAENGCAEAAPYLERAHEARRAAYGDAHSSTLRTLALLAPVRLLTGDLDGARALLASGRASSRADAGGPRRGDALKLESYAALAASLRGDAAIDAPALAAAAFRDSAAYPNAGLVAVGVAAAVAVDDEARRNGLLVAAAARFGPPKVAQQLAFLRLVLVPLTGEFHALTKNLKAAVSHVELALGAGILDPSVRPRGVL